MRISVITISGIPKTSTVLTNPNFFLIEAF